MFFIDPPRRLTKTLMPQKKEKFQTSVSSDQLSIRVDLSTEQLCDAVGKIEFCSRLLYALTPNHDRVWTVSSKSPRVNAHVLGFPPHIGWSRPSDKSLVGMSTQIIRSEDVNDLEMSIEGLIGSKASTFSNTEYLFFIRNVDEQRTYDYSFSSRARSFVAFCILWDLQSHPRDHLELWRDPQIPYLEDFPAMTGLGTPIKTYGDPSKTVDELRNQGFPRDTDGSPNGSRLEITRSQRYGTSQEHYRLLSRVQSLSDRVGRSQIPSRYKAALYKKFDYRCNNCGEVYDISYLAPDHRVPSIVQPDNLAESNYLDVLQTLCVRCNQVKREACKKCPYGHNCDACAWAFPERNGISAHNLKVLQQYARKENRLVNALLAEKFPPLPE